jgi:lipoprotein-anchoring transpeptidase ErfK/SrfK
MLDVKTKLKNIAWSTPARKVLGVFVIVSVLAVAGRMAMVSFYNGRIMPGVVAAGYNVGGMSLDQARNVLTKEAKSYTISVKVGEKSFQAVPSDLGVIFNAGDTLSSAYGAGRYSLLPVIDQKVPMTYSLDRAKLDVFTADVAKQIGVAAVDASVEVKNGQADAVADKPGTSVDQKNLRALIEKSLQYPGSNADLSLNVQQLPASVKQADLSGTVALANKIISTSITLTYDSTNFKPDKTEIGNWLTFSKQLDKQSDKVTVQVDENKVRDYIKNVAGNVDKGALSKLVSVRAGVSTTTREGQKGVSMDQGAAVAAVVTAANNHQDLSYQIATNQTDFTTLTTVVNLSSTCATLDGHVTYVEVNVSRQHLCVWDNGNVIYESAITTGALVYDTNGSWLGTPSGLYAIYAKTTNFWMGGRDRGFTYDAVHVDYWMPFYLGYGIHDSCNSVSCWRSSWGGQDYTYNGSHGCVNAPNATAAFIYNWSVIGTKVWVHT